MTFASVVLPAPLGPTMHTASPAPTERLTPASASIPLYENATSLTVSSDSPFVSAAGTALPVCRLTL